MRLIILVLAIAFLPGFQARALEPKHVPAFGNSYERALKQFRTYYERSQLTRSTVDLADILKELEQEFAKNEHRLLPPLRAPIRSLCEGALREARDYLKKDDLAGAQAVVERAARVAAGFGVHL